MQKELKVNIGIQNRDKLFALAIVWYPIFNVYSAGILPLGDLIIVALLALKVLRRRPQKKSHEVKLYMLFLCYSLILLPIQLIFLKSISVGEVFGKVFHLLLYSYLGVIYSWSSLEIDAIKKGLKSVSYYISLIVIFEKVISIVFGIHLYLLLPFLNLNYSITDYNQYLTEFVRTIGSQGYRPSGVFLEPAHYCAYAILGFILILTDTSKNKNIKSLIIISLGMLVSLSTGGIICLAICWCYYFFFIKDKKNSTTKMLLFLIGIGAAIFIVQSQAHLVQTVLNRLTELGSTIYDTSANRRILRGFYVWLELSPILKIFGTGLGCLKSYITQNRILVLTDSLYSDEMNMLSYLMCSSGIVGTVLYFEGMIMSFLKESKERKLIILIYCVTAVFSNWLFHALSVLYLVLIYDRSNQAKKFG